MRTGQLRFTEREIAVMEYACAGFPDREIAAKLGVGPATVRTHMRHVYLKTGANNRVRLLRWAQDKGMA